jgi:hypothetical protein
LVLGGGAIGTLGRGPVLDNAALKSGQGRLQQVSKQSTLFAESPRRTVIGDVARDA